MTELTKFDPSIYGSPMLYCLLHDDEGEATAEVRLIALRIVHILSIRRKEGGAYVPRTLYSLRSIATIVGSSKDTVARSLAWLESKDAVSQKGGKWWLVENLISVSDQRQESAEVSPASDSTVSSQRHKYNNNNINKNIYIKELRPEYEEHFGELNDDILSDNRFVALLKRPLRKYPEVWVNYEDLDIIFKTFQEYNLPESEYSYPFRVCNARMLTQPDYKKKTINVLNWIISWALRDALDMSIKSGIRSKKNAK